MSSNVLASVQSQRNGNAVENDTLDGVSVENAFTLEQVEKSSAVELALPMKGQCSFLATTPTSPKTISRNDGLAVRKKPWSLGGESLT